MAKLFRSNRSQAVRLPRVAEFPAAVTDVEVQVHGNIRVLVPKMESWGEWFENGPRLSEDFPDLVDDPIPDASDVIWP